MEYLLAAAKIAEVLVAAGQDLAPLYRRVSDALRKPGGPTEADMDALKAIEDAQSAEISAPFDDETK